MNSLRGHADAQFHLGLMHFDGVGGPVSKGVGYIGAQRPGCRAMRARTPPGTMYYEGKCGRVEREGAGLVRRAARQGLREAQNDLGSVL